MNLKDTEKKYGAFSKLLHWGVALTIVGMFALGYWMRTLDYYSKWYMKAPHIHESVGLLLFIVVPIFLFWRLKNQNPDDSYLKPYEKLTSGLMKIALYVLMIALLISGYLISTAGDTPVALFNWIELPALITVNESKVLIGNIHQYMAYFIILLAIIHALAAFKHHFIDKDKTLSRMLPFVKIK
ncbi:MAG: cytochrome b [Alphaproteobacteria bacterium]|nr:cytochrome b [Alphaproteobacteria bacterium]HRW28404.1 cytochrome b [Emcibacteraceae bacterium]